MKLAILTIASALVVTASLSASDDSDIESRLKTSNCLVATHSDPSILKRIHRLLDSKQETEKLIGRSSTFFPIFDLQLKEYKLPEELKYITMFETDLNNGDVSHSGATGIWQLMRDVKEEFGLRVDNVVDERYDLARSTEAALKDLKRMYEATGSWELALAGYNCGMGRLNDAFKRSRSKDFEKVKKFLPEETKNYIPKFVAFNYLMKNYRHHGLHPRLPIMDKQVVGSVKVYNYITLQQVADVTGIPFQLIKDLNPQYGESYVPENPKGSNIFLPRRVTNALVEFVSHSDAQPLSPMNFSPIVINEDIPALKEDPDYFSTTYTVGEGETLEALSELFNCNAYNIQMWNHLEGTALTVGQELTLYMPRVIPKKV